MALERRRARIFFDDGTGHVRKKDVAIRYLDDGIMHFVDIYDNMEQVVPITRIYRVILFEEGDDGQL